MSGQSEESKLSKITFEQAEAIIKLNSNLVPFYSLFSVHTKYEHRLLKMLEIAKFASPTPDDYMIRLVGTSKKIFLVACIRVYEHFIERNIFCEEKLNELKNLLKQKKEILKHTKNLGALSTMDTLLKSFGTHLRYIKEFYQLIHISYFNKEHSKYLGSKFKREYVNACDNINKLRSKYGKRYLEFTKIVQEVYELRIYCDFVKFKDDVIELKSLIDAQSDLLNNGSNKSMIPQLFKKLESLKLDAQIFNTYFHLPKGGEHTDNRYARYFFERYSNNKASLKLPVALINIKSSYDESHSNLLYYEDEIISLKDKINSMAFDYAA